MHSRHNRAINKKRPTNTNVTDIFKVCQDYFVFDLLSVMIEKRSRLRHFSTV